MQRKKRKEKRSKWILFGILIVILIVVIFSLEVFVDLAKVKNMQPLSNKGEEEMRFATYNMMFGMYGRSAITNLLGFFAFHGIHSVRLTDFLSKYNDQDVAFVMKSNPDVVSLNEVLGSLRKDLIIEDLKKQGYNYFCWGSAAHYAPPMDLGTLLASKYKFEEINFTLPMVGQMGGGGGACAAYFKDKNIVVLAVHLSIKKDLELTQLDAVSEFIKEQEKQGRRIILMGDFNEEEKSMDNDEEFKDLNLTSSNEKKTCPNVNLIKKFDFKAVDNIFHDSSFKLEDSGVLSGYSDHKLVWADLK